MSIIRNRTARDRRKARQYRLERLTERMGTLAALIDANPYEGRYPSSGGIRGSDIANPTLQAVLAPDRIEGALTLADDAIEAAVRLLEDAATHLRAVETHDTPKERENFVEVCRMCAVPDPKARWWQGRGPYCRACYQSVWAATTGGQDIRDWEKRRMQHLAETG